MAQAILQVSVFLFSFFKVNSEIYLHNTNDALSIESYDCVLVNSSLFYCRRPSEPIDLFRDKQSTECQFNDGRLHRFSELRSKNISISTILHQWRSSLERVEDYSRYWKDSSPSDGLICECLRPGSFGKNCEYRLPVGKTFEETLNWQLIMRKDNPWEVQAYGDIVCYQTLQCQSGALCLDWREICDGFQQCLSGRDEENCDLLEMNQCDPDEYRCQNGMCVSEEFFLDGQRDCLDWSDEILFKTSEECSRESANEQCDDHLCLSNQWSCGDGQCINERLGFYQWASRSCVSERDQYFICETHPKKRQWTMSNGRCLDLDRHQGPYQEEEEEEECSSLLRCSLTQNGVKECSCHHQLNCLDQLKDLCSSSLIQYPRRSIVAPFLFFLFNGTRSSGTRKLPDWMKINGTIRCDHSFITVIEKVIPFESDFNVNDLIEDHFCQPSRNVSWTEVDQSRRDRCHHGNESVDQCRGWNPCLSNTRINDGSEECRYGTDEGKEREMDIEQSCARVRRHRFRCSPEQPTCLSLTSLDDGNFRCRN